MKFAADYTEALYSNSFKIGYNLLNLFRISAREQEFVIPQMVWLEGGKHV